MYIIINLPGEDRYNHGFILIVVIYLNHSEEVETCHEIFTQLVLHR